MPQKKNLPPTIYERMINSMNNANIKMPKWFGKESISSLQIYKYGY